MCSRILRIAEGFRVLELELLLQNLHSPINTPNHRHLLHESSSA